VKNILIIRKHNQIGDILCSLPLYAAVRKKYPLSKITLVASPTNYPIPFKELNPFIDDVIFYDKSSFSSLVKFYFLLWKRSYIMSIVPSTVRMSFTSHIIGFLSGAELRVGVNTIDGVKNKAAFLLNTKADFNWDKYKVHQSERNLEIARLAGCNLCDDEKEIRLNFSETVGQSAYNFLDKNFPLDKIIIGFHPGAGKTANIWNTGNFIQLITDLYKTYNNYVLLTCGPIDNEVIDKITSELDQRNIPWVTSKGLSLLELTSILDKISLYITNDTGTMHIAGVTNVNQISLFGPTKAYEWAPSGDGKYYFQSVSGDINEIRLDTVLELCNNILGVYKNGY
jgi:heptosyltransferase-2